MKRTTYDPEKFNLNVARIKKGGENYEIVVDPDSAIAFKEGKEIEIIDILKYEKIFSDAQKGQLSPEKNFKESFGTEVILEIAKIILEKGECRKNIFLEGLPVKKNSHAWNLKMSEESDRPTFLAYNSSILSGDMKRDAIIFSPYDIAAYWALATKEAEQGNTDLWVNNPFMVPSQKFLSRMVAISNNVVVKDSRNSKGFRHFRLEELCKLAKHVIMDLGYSGSAYSRANDGSIKEYIFEITLLFFYLILTSYYQKN